METVDLPPRPMPEALERGFFLGWVVAEGWVGVVSLRAGRREEEWEEEEVGEEAAAVGMLEGLLPLDAPLLPLLVLLLLLLVL